MNYGFKVQVIDPVKSKGFRFDSLLTRLK